MKVRHFLPNDDGCAPACSICQICRPVRKAARDGLQPGAGQEALVNNTPSGTTAPRAPPFVPPFAHGMTVRWFFAPMPDLIVFDLDLTLWHCGPVLWCDQLTPPVRRTSRGKVRASCQSEVRLYPDVPALLGRLTESGQLLAVASRTDAPDIARKLLDLLNIGYHFSHQQIYPGDKTRHFHALQQETGVAYEDMLFFDDEPRNIASVSGLGVTCHLVRGGMKHALLASALAEPPPA